MKGRLMKNFLTFMVSIIVILFFFMNSATAETSFLGDYPKDREPGWSNECQGVTHDASYWYVTQKDRLWKFPISYDLNKQVSKDIKRVGIPEILKNNHYNHFGDLDIYQGYLYIPLEDKENRQPKIVVFKAQDLSFVAEANLDVAQGGGHAMSCAVNPQNGRLYVAQYRHGDPSGIRVLLYHQEIKEGRLILRYLSKLSLYEEDGRKALYPRSIQGLEFSKTSGLLYLVSDIGSAGGIFIFDPNTGKRLQRIKVGYDPTYAGYVKEELEGITIWDLDGGQAPNIRGQVHLIMIDNVGRGADDLYFKHFRVPGERHLSGREDCLPINYPKLEIRKIESYWQLFDGSHVINVFHNPAEAQKAKIIINSYKINQVCFVGRPHSSMVYYLANGKSPQGTSTGEDCLRFDSSRIEMKWMGGRWRIEDGTHVIIDFGDEGLECLATLQYIKKYGFTNRCFVGRPNPSMVYFRK